MAEYWGLEAIARRVGVHVKTLLRLYDAQRFLMFQRYRALPPRKPRKTWYTNDELIARWQVAQCASQWRVRDAKRQASKRGRRVDDRGEGVKA